MADISDATNSESGSWIGLAKQGASGLVDLILDYGKSKVIDVETTYSDRNIPDQNDLVNGSAGIASSDALGGTYGQATPQNWLMYAGFALAGVAALILIKKVV
ncbi:LPXTG cell wall anchor domain-containing protein [Zhongshania sp. BJYM1]|uniref:LPXTG cell wall anchor domain-containing protein n=1 Tax=Zhongshania aquatica TaxID=2965069 RepID=UPI0022B50F96|nr:LPXTG cell wall anchor domain-containing protein [Marortus sp. BJYM1]